MRAFLCILGLALALLICNSPVDGLTRIPRAVEDEDNFDFSSEEDDRAPSTFQRIGRVINEIVQVPVYMFKALNSFFSSGALTRLREEMQNLNISYPK